MRQSVAMEFSPLIGVSVAAVLGGAIGVQRQAAHKPAGFRTHLLVATAAAAFTAMGAHLGDTRIPSYIVVGVGFLGGGAIIRQGNTAHGLTTAASIWMAAAIGLEMGYSDGFGLWIALLLTAITLIALSIADDDLMHIFHIPRKAVLRVTCVTPETSLATIGQAFAQAKIAYDSSEIAAITSEGSSQVIEVTYLVRMERGRDMNAIVREVGALPGVRRIQAHEPTFAG